MKSMQTKQLDSDVSYISYLKGPELTVVIPTFNEKDNVEEVVKRLDNHLAGISWEAIFVDDDSADGTAREVRKISQKDHRIRIVQRVGRRGLSTACIEGMLASSAPYLAVMDADLQHDIGLLPEMLKTLKQEQLDIVVGSRYVEGGSTGDWASDRQHISRFATKLSKFILRVDLKDPMSGFFMVKSTTFDGLVRKLSGIGFKILLDIFSSASRPLAFKELPYTFCPRIAGESKLDIMVSWEFIMMLLDKKFGRIIPARFVFFGVIGALGVLVHMGVLAALLLKAETNFTMAQSMATLVAMTFNFGMNNIFTYHDRRIKGWRLIKGWLSFTIACSVGAISNVGIATYLFQHEQAGWVYSAIAGIIVGAVWNYAVTSVYTWNKPKTA